MLLIFHRITRSMFPCVRQAQTSVKELAWICTLPAAAYNDVEYMMDPYGC